MQLLGQENGQVGQKSGRKKRIADTNHNGGHGLSTWADYFFTPFTRKVKPMSNRAAPKSSKHQLLAVVDLGEKADYRSEVRHRIAAELPFRVSKRSSARQLTEIYQQVQMALHDLLPTSCRSLHVWLLDNQSGEPCLFISGRMKIRQGLLTKQEAERLDEIVRPQVACAQETKGYEFLLDTHANAWGCAEEFDCPDDGDEEERESAVLSGIFGWADQYELVDSDPSDEESVFVTAQLWHKFTLDLPFEPSAICSQAQLGYILGEARKLVKRESLGDLYDLEIEDLDVRLMDRSGRTTDSIFGWVRSKEASLEPTTRKRRGRSPKRQQLSTGPRVA